MRHLRGVLRRDDHDQLVRGERDRLLDQPGGPEILHRLRARGQDHVCAGAVADLRREVVRAAEDDGRIRIDLGRDLTKGGRGEHGRRLIVPVPTATAGEKNAGRENGGAGHRSTITDVDLTTPAAAIARLEAELLDRLPGDDRDDARRLRHVDLDAGEEAVELDRADDPAEAVAGGERLVGTRPAEALHLVGRDDAPVGVVPLDADLAARSQRRSVSTLIPSARAASAAELA